MENTELKMKAEQLAAEVSAAKAEATAAKAEVATLKQEIEMKGSSLDEAQKQIDNLDASIKEQQKTIDSLQVAVKANKPADFRQAFRDAFYSQKANICEMAKNKNQRFSMNLELKTIVSIGTSTAITANSLSLQSDPTIHSANPAANVFIATFGLRPRTANKLSWVESTSQNSAAYVAELAQNSAKSDVVFVEKQRSFAKIATYMTISTEVEDWFDQIYNYCVNEGTRMIEDKIDREIYAGDGHDTNHPTDIYGLKDAATAFSALAAGAVAKANVADVIMDACDQIAKEGFNANVAFVTWGVYRKLREVKDDNGNYLYDRVSGMLNGVRVLPTTHITTGDILVADSNCVEIYAGNSYEVEFIRNGSIDGYDVYFRKAAQVKVPTPKKKGLIYVANVTTAIAALTPAS